MNFSIDSDILALKKVKFSWKSRSSFVLYVENFTLSSGRTALILGESGSGKSTLLSLICGTILPEIGNVMVAGRKLSSLSASDRDYFRGEMIGVIFQQFNLLPFASVLDNILLPLRFAPMRRQRVSDARSEVLALSLALGLSSELMNNRANTLSVGQQQRVAVARALIGRPPLIVADEPTSSLDTTNQAIFLDVLFEQIQKNNTSLLMVSHDSQISERFDEVFFMDDIVVIERDMV